MNISATTPDGEKINLLEISVDGMAIYETYISSAGDLRVKQTSLDIHNPYTVIGLSATIN